MGGKALSKPSIRLGATEFYDLKTIIEEQLPHTSVIPSYSDKDSFGDIDVLYYEDKYSDCKFVQDMLHMSNVGVCEVVKNGPVTSYGLLLQSQSDEMFQMDMIKVPFDSFYFAYNYFSYNDLGNLIGRIAHSIGLKFGHLGLTYVQRSKTNPAIILKEHMLTRDFDKALDFLSLDSYRFAEGFQNLEEIFTYVTTSPFFIIESYIPSNRNREARTRDAKRPTYTAFLKWAEEQGYDVNAKSSDVDKEGFLEYAFYQFPEFEMEYVRMQELDDENNLAKSFYNGDVVKEKLKIEGKELGDWMRFADSIVSNKTIIAFGHDVGLLIHAIDRKYKMRY